MPVILAAVAAAVGLAVGPTAGSAQADPAPPTGGALGPNVIVFTPDMPESQIQNTLNTISDQQVPNQFGTQRYAILFAPGTYGTTADPLSITVGYYTSIAGLGQNPNQVVINGRIDAYNQCFGGQTNCVALDNFWRSLTNLTIDVAGGTGCFTSTEMWAVSQAAPMRRVQVNGGTTLMDYCDGSPDYASGGFIADSKFTGGTVVNGSQQQWITRDSQLDGWSNSVWNQVFCGDPGAPAQNFTADSGHNGAPAYTTLANCPVTREAPYLYQDAAGRYRVFVPSVQHNSSGPTWAAGNTPGTSLPLSSFYVVNSASTVGQINAALRAGDNLLFTPGVYAIPRTIQVTRPDTKIIGLGFATLVPTNGNVTMTVADVPGVNLTGLIFDAGPVRSPVLLKLGTRGSVIHGVGHDPVTVDDVFFRVGGATAGSARTSFEDDIDNSILDDIWAWRADHGAGAGTWTGDQASTGVVVYADNVTAYGLAVEHYQKTEVVWTGQHGFVLFFQNENPYEVPNQAAWMANRHQNGYPAFRLTDGVTSFQGYGMGSYSYFDQGVDIENSMAFEAPNRPGVQFHDLFTVFLNGSGGFQSIINGTGAPVHAGSGGQSNLVSYP